jgi:hypothetical protein
MVALSFWMASTVEPGGDFGRVESDEPTGYL